MGNHRLRDEDQPGFRERLDEWFQSTQFRRVTVLAVVGILSISSVVYASVPAVVPTLEVVPRWTSTAGSPPPAPVMRGPVVDISRPELPEPVPPPSVPTPTPTQPIPGPVVPSTTAPPSPEVQPSSAPVSNPPSSVPPVVPDTDTAAELLGWQLLRADEFEYVGSPDPEMWVNAPQECMRGHNGNGRRCGGNTVVADGVLKMTGEMSGDTGWLASRFDRQYGRWEMRVRSVTSDLEAGRQYHPVLLVWPKSNRWPQDGEYDFLETSAPGVDCAAAFMHYPHSPGPVQQEYAQLCSVDLSQWHNIAFEWTPEYVAGYIDGVQWFKFSGGAGQGRKCIQCMPSGHVTIQLDNFYGGSMTPAILEVDWYREYA